MRAFRESRDTRLGVGSVALMDSLWLPRIRTALRRSAPYLGLLILNFLVFVPAYVCTSADFFPKLPHADIRPFEFRAYVSMWMRRYNQDVFRISLDLGLMALILIATASTRYRALIRRLFAVYYTSLILFLSYHYAVSTFFERRPALGEDWRFLLNLSHFLSGVMSPGWFLVIVSAVAAIVATFVLCLYTFHGLQLKAAGWSWRTRGKIAFAFLVPCIALLSWLGLERDSPVIQLVSKHVIANWRTSTQERLRLAELREAVPDRRYDSFLDLRLAKKPNFYLLMVEAYGEILATWDMTDAYRALMARVQERLEHAGYHTATTYSASPVHSGTSWFAISTTHTGTVIDRPIPYAALELVGARVPSLTRFFDRQGYTTYTLQPGSNDRAGMRRLDLFNHDVVVSAVELDYHGVQYGWGNMPDQYSWGKFRQNWFAKPVEPYYVYYMAVSTHWQWENVPPYVRDWRAFIDNESIPPADHTNWPPFPEAETIGTELRRHYFESVEYEFRLFLDLLEAETSPNIVVAIVGDHQPRLETNAPGTVTMNSPVHMVSRDPAFIEQFVEAGFTPGMFAAPRVRPRFWHEGFFSLWVSKLVASYGTPDSPAVPVYPRGIRLSTISR